jgi:glycine/D-amino acid oxidase-like deaminating enzyme
MHNYTGCHEFSNKHRPFRKSANFFLCDVQVLFSPTGGIVESERAIEAHIKCALRRGADALYNTTIADWRCESGNVFVRFQSGKEVCAKSLIICAGAWIPDLIPELQGFLQPERQVVGWFKVCSRLQDHNRSN